MSYENNPEFRKYEEGIESETIHEVAVSEVITKDGETIKIKSDNENFNKKDMPTIKEFASAKVAEGFSFLGKKAKQGTRYAKLQSQLLSLKGDMNTLAKKIGYFNIDQILNETHEPIPEELVRNVRDIQRRIDDIEEALKNNVN